MRIIFVPQFPSELRYQEWWFTEFPKQFRKRGFEVLTLGEKYVETIQARRSTLDMFSPINQAIEFETEQIREYMLLDIQDDDILFLADLSFPGLFANVLYHNKCNKMYAFCHATSANNYDYFEADRRSKFPVESGHSFLFDSVFVGSKYHQKKLKDMDNRYWRNTIVTYLPFQPYEGSIETFVPKKHRFMSASRPGIQKVDMELENRFEEVTREKIFRPISNTWDEYFTNLRASKFLLITSKEDTFGYQIIDAIRNGCYPLARNSLAYPEILPREFLYNDFDDLILRLDCLEIGISEGEKFKASIPRPLCEEQMDKFYDVICEEMEV